MMVRDIYGDHSPFAELHGDLLASSFAKIANDHSTGDMKEKYRKEDILASLVCMISFNIGQLAYFQAHLHKCPRIYFVGNFVRNNLLGMANLRKIVDLMQSSQRIEARFMKHDGYIGALGAFMNDL